MTRKRDLVGRIAAGLDIPREVLPGGFGLMLSGERELTVRGCKRILTYGSEEIALALGATSLTVRGHELVCTSFSGGAITVVGEILSLTLGEVSHAT